MSERGDVADWLGTGLQSPLIGFDSRRRLKLPAWSTHFWYCLDFIPGTSDVRRVVAG